VHNGPVAWNGILAWWVLCVSFFVWMVAMTWLMLRASHIAERTEAEGSTILQPRLG